MQKIRKGNLYALFDPVWIKTNKFYTTRENIGLNCFARILLFSFLLFTDHLAAAQSTDGENPGTGPLGVDFKAVGNSLNAKLWDMQFPTSNGGSKSLASLAHNKKILILDFWATWCPPCVKSLPEFHELQKEFADEVAIVSITKEPMELVSSFLKRHKLEYINSIVEDSLLSISFPHRTIPHMVWMDGEGHFLGTTRGADVTVDNIRQVLRNGKISIQQKIDEPRDRPMLLSTNLKDLNRILNYSIFFKGNYPGLPAGQVRHQTEDGTVYGRRFSNAQMYDMIYSVASALLKKDGGYLNESNTLIDVAQPEKLKLIQNTDGSFSTDNQYNYELILPLHLADSLNHYILRDLNIYSDYTISIEKRMTDCYVLVRTSNRDKLATKGGQKVNNFSKSQVILKNSKIAIIFPRLYANGIRLPIVDETGYLGNVDIEIDNLSDLQSFRKGLFAYDLDLVHAKREVKMLVIKDK